MKIDRLIGILSILLQKQNTTASELAQRFEVSRRLSPVVNGGWWRNSTRILL